VTLPVTEEQRSTVFLDGLPDASSEARKAVGRLGRLGAWPDMLFAAQLLTAELVVNVLRHAGLPAGERFPLILACSAARARVEVVDGGSGFDAPAVLRAHGESGSSHRGIALVNSLADRWGYLCEPGGCHVWFEIDLVSGPRPWRGREPVQRRV
jgi:anti-sigma regulatory factor (Ser/Thr protein kinase)